MPFLNQKSQVKISNKNMLPPYWNTLLKSQIPIKHLFKSTGLTRRLSTVKKYWPTLKSQIRPSIYNPAISSREAAACNAFGTSMILLPSTINNSWLTGEFITVLTCASRNYRVIANEENLSIWFRLERFRTSLITILQRTHQKRRIASGDIGPDFRPPERAVAGNTFALRIDRSHACSCRFPDDMWACAYPFRTTCGHDLPFPNHPVWLAETIAQRADLFCAYYRQLGFTRF